MSTDLNDGGKRAIAEMAYGTPKQGCYFDHGNYTNEQLSRRIIELANSLGWFDDSDALKLAEFSHNGWLNDDGIECLNEASESAIEYLNGLESRTGMHWSNNGEAGAFGLWADVESARDSVGFVSSKEQEYPDEDFRGEWLHVNDHGNCTLYIREEREGHSLSVDREIWSLV